MNEEIILALESIGQKKTECDCVKCGMMCLVSPCFPTPAQVVEAVKNGHQDRYWLTLFHDMKRGITWPVIAPKGLPSIEPWMTRCTFLTEDLKCEIHGTEYKGIEGQYLSHESTEEDCDPVRLAVCMSWITNEGREVIKNMFPNELDEFDMLCIMANMEVDQLIELQKL